MAETNRRFLWHRFWLLMTFIAAICLFFLVLLPDAIQKEQDHSEQVKAQEQAVQDSWKKTIDSLGVVLDSVYTEIRRLEAIEDSLSALPPKLHTIYLNAEKRIDNASALALRHEFDSLFRANGVD